jgi:hypothetical protein
MQARHERAQARFIKRNPLPPTECAYAVYTPWVAADPWNRMEVAFTPGAVAMNVPFVVTDTGYAARRSGLSLPPCGWVAH